MSEMIAIETRHGPMPALIEWPERANGCGLVLSMSVWGLNTDLLSYAEYMAALGYAVVAPNLFWQVETDHAVEYDMGRLPAIGDMMRRHSDEGSVDNLKAAATELRRRAACGRIGVAGWCYGGRIACIAGADRTFDAVAGFYPTALETRLDLAGRLRTPTSIHLAEIERYATRPDAIAVIRQAFAEDAGADVFVYRGAEHGFGFGPQHPSHNEAAARLAYTRAALFFQDQLVGEAR